MKSMKKQIALRALMGLPIGVTIGVIISLLGSITFSPDSLHVVHPALVAAVGGENAAFAIQLGFCALAGALFAGGSIIWGLDHWSLLKQSAVYFVIAMLAVLSAAYICYWMPHTLAGVLQYLLLFVFIFLSVWLGQYLGWKARIQKMNRKMNEESK